MWNGLSFRYEARPLAELQAYRTGAICAWGAMRVESISSCAKSAEG